MNDKTGRGGFRIGAGRKKGTKISKNTTVFYAKCTEEEKTKLKEFLNKLRGLSVILLLMFALPCFAAESSWNVEAPKNIPDDVHIKIEPGFVYAGGISKPKFKTPNSFKLSAYRTGSTSYSIDMNEAYITIDNTQHKLIQPVCYNYLYSGEKHPKILIYKDVRFSYYDYIAPIENIYYSKLVNNYTEPVKSSLISAYTFPIKFNDKKSILKNKTDCLITIPLKNDDSSKTENLVFKVTL